MLALLKLGAHLYYMYLYYWAEIPCKMKVRLFICLYFHWCKIIVYHWCYCYHGCKSLPKHCVCICVPFNRSVCLQNELLTILRRRTSMWLYCANKTRWSGNLSWKVVSDKKHFKKPWQPNIPNRVVTKTSKDCKHKIKADDLKMIP